MAAPNHLVIVCGHGIWLGGPAKGQDEAEWLIESYKAGETPTFVEHIKAGLQVLAEDERAVVVFSGGPTRPETRLSEGRSYANLAAANDYFGYLPTAWAGQEATDSATEKADTASGHRRLHPRVLVDEQALDSYHNIMFSLLTFWRAFGSGPADQSAANAHAAAAWPVHLTIVSHGFKRRRLVDGHCGPDAIGFPLENVSFIGISPPNIPAEFSGGGEASGVSAAAGTPETVQTRGVAKMAKTPLDKADAMKDAHSVMDYWLLDPHGTGPLLAGKRRARNPWQMSQLFFDSDEERRRSGLRTVFVGVNKDMEALAADSPRPWGREEVDSR